MQDGRDFQGESILFSAFDVKICDFDRLFSFDSYLNIFSSNFTKNNALEH